jgi:hypothetical protein
MKPERRKSLALLILALLFLLAILFRSFLFENIITPISLIFLLIWRVIISVDQRFYWTVLIIAVLFYAFSRFILEPTPLDPYSTSSSNLTLENLNYWRTSIKITSEDPGEPNYLKRKLVDMLVSAHASNLPDTAILEIYESLQNGLIPLSPPIYEFLFPVDAYDTKPSLKKMALTIWFFPRKMFHRWNGQTRADYYRSINEVLSYLELLTENKT